MMLQLRKAVLRGIAAHYLKIDGQVINNAQAGRAESGIHGAKRRPSAETRRQSGRNCHTRIETRFR